MMMMTMMINPRDSFNEYQKDTIYLLQVIIND